MLTASRPRVGIAVVACAALSVLLLCSAFVTVAEAGIDSAVDNPAPAPAGILLRH